MQSVSVPIPLLSSLITNNTSTNFLFNSHSLKSPTAINTPNNLTPRTHTMPKSSYNDTAISTELECFITKSSSSDSLRINDEDDIHDIDLSSNDEFDTIKPSTLTKSELEVITIETIDNHSQDTDAKSKKYKKYQKRKKRSYHPCHEYQPQWLQYLNTLDRSFSSKIHRLSCGTIDYLFVFGAFVFGSKFMPITILLSIFLVDIPGFIYLLLSCTITVTLTQFGKKLFGRHRPDPKTLAPKKLDFRTRLTNYSFPSGDTAQVKP